MNCKTAQKVWGHPGGFLKGLKAACPGVIARVGEVVHDVLGDEGACRMLETHFSHLFGRSISLGNLCCSGCKASFGKAHDREIYAIQNAAVRTDENGENIDLPKTS